jgi:hypothetical protein
VREILFPGSNDGSSSEGERDRRPRKRRKTDMDMDEDVIPSIQLNGKADGSASKDMILENDVDRYLLSVDGAQEMDVNNAGLGVRRYKISLFPKDKDSIGKNTAEGAQGAQEVKQHEAGVSMNGVAQKTISLTEPDPIMVTPVIQEYWVKPDLLTETNPTSQSIDKDEAHETNGAASIAASMPAQHTRSQDNKHNNDDTLPAARTASIPHAPAAEVPSKPPLQDIAGDLGEGDVLFVPDGIRIARGKVVGDPPRTVDEACSKVDWFMKVTRWKWREPSRGG